MNVKKNFIVSICLFFILALGGVKTLGADEGLDYEYFVPHVVSYPEFYPAHHGYTQLIVVVGYDDTYFEVDENGDGVFEASYPGVAAGEYFTFYRTNWPSPSGIMETGASVRGDKPLQVLLFIGINDFGTFDAGMMYASLYPIHDWGNRFIIPVESTYLYLFCNVDAEVTLHAPDNSVTSHSISAGANIKLSGVEAGTKIVADSPIYVLALNCQPDQNYPWMFNVLPESFLGKEYYHDSTYGECDISWPWPTDPHTWIMAFGDDTSVEIDEDHDGIPEYSYLVHSGEAVDYSSAVQGAHIMANKKVCVAQTENWATPFIGKYGGAATEFLPVDHFGKEFALYDVRDWREIPENNPRIFVVAAHDNTLVEVDFGWDGVDTGRTLSKGENWNVFWPEDIATTARIKSTKNIQVIYRSDWSHPHHPGVNTAYTALPLDLKAAIEAEIVVDPQTLELKSQGKYVTAYIQLPEGYDVEDIDASTVAIVAIDGVALSVPIAVEEDPAGAVDEDEDGIIDYYMVKFSRPALIALLDKGDRIVTVAGSLEEGERFSGDASIRVID